MNSVVFHDCLGRQIRVGDVIVYGNRDRNYGSITPGVVTGFAPGKILVTKYMRSRWRKGDPRRLSEGYWTYGDQCFITGMTEDQLRQIVTLDESEEKQ